MIWTCRTQEDHEQYAQNTSWKIRRAYMVR